MFAAQGPDIEAVAMEAENPLWDAIDKAAEIADPARRQASLESIVPAVRRLTADTCCGANAWYMLGYLLYMLPERMKDVSVQSEVESALSRAISIRNNFDMARLYLGYHYYDLRQYDAAASVLSGRTTPCLDEFYNLKWEELRLCVNIQRFGMEKSVRYLEQFVVEARKHPPEDLWLFLLERVVKQDSSVISPSVRSRIFRCLEELDLLSGFDGWLTKSD